MRLVPKNCTPFRLACRKSAFSKSAPDTDAAFRSPTACNCAPRSEVFRIFAAENDPPVIVALSRVAFWKLVSVNRPCLRVAAAFGALVAGVAGHWAASAVLADRQGVV